MELVNSQPGVAVVVEVAQSTLQGSGLACSSTGHNIRSHGGRGEDRRRELHGGGRGDDRVW